MVLLFGLRVSAAKEFSAFGPVFRVHEEIELTSRPYALNVA